MYFVIEFFGILRWERRLCPWWRDLTSFSSHSGDGGREWPKSSRRSTPMVPMVGEGWNENGCLQSLQGLSRRSVPRDLGGPQRTTTDDQRDRHGSLYPLLVPGRYTKDRLRGKEVGPGDFTGRRRVGSVPLRRGSLGPFLDLSRPRVP